MYIYAQIDENGKCFAVSMLSGPIVAPNMIPLAQYDESYLGRTYQNGQWQ